MMKSEEIARLDSLVCLLASDHRASKERQKSRKKCHREINNLLNRPIANWRAAVRRAVNRSSCWRYGTADIFCEMFGGRTAKESLRLTAELWRAGGPHSICGKFLIDGDISSRAAILAEIRHLTGGAAK